MADVIPFPAKPPAEDRPQHGGEFVEIINEIARRWGALPDDHPMFDGGRRLLARMAARRPGEPPPQTPPHMPKPISIKRPPRPKPGGKGRPA